MADEAADGFARDPEPREHAVECLSKLLLNEGRDGAGEDNAEALWVDAPAHDVERVGPIVLGPAFHRGQPALSNPQHASRGAVAEQRRRDEVGDLEVVEPEGE